MGGRGRFGWKLQGKAVSAALGGVTYCSLQLLVQCTYVVFVLNHSSSLKSRMAIKDSNLAFPCRFSEIERNRSLEKEGSLQERLSVRVKGTVSRANSGSVKT